MMIWKLKDMIKRGIITFQNNDTVIVFRRKSNGYPRHLKDGDEYIIQSVSCDSLFVSQHSTDGVGWNQQIKVNKTYMIPKNILRDVKINSILDETNKNQTI